MRAGIRYEAETGGVWNEAQGSYRALERGSDVAVRAPAQVPDVEQRPRQPARAPDDRDHERQREQQRRGAHEDERENRQHHEDRERTRIPAPASQRAQPLAVGHLPREHRERDEERQDQDAGGDRDAE